VTTSDIEFILRYRARRPDAQADEILVAYQRHCARFEGIDPLTIPLDVRLYGRGFPRTLAKLAQ
jgi:hypothetical protein